MINKFHFDIRHVTDLLLNRIREQIMVYKIGMIPSATYFIIPGIFLHILFDILRKMKKITQQ